MDLSLSSDRLYEPMETARETVCGDLFDDEAHPPNDPGNAPKNSSNERDEGTFEAEMMTM
jgi:hypothetical protein